MNNNYSINEFIHAEKIETPGRKTSIYKIINTATNTELAEVMWCSNFRKYAFYPREDTVFDKKCLLDIITFLDLIHKEYYNSKNN